MGPERIFPFCGKMDQFRPHGLCTAVGNSVSYGIKASGGRRIPRKGNWLLAQPCSGACATAYTFVPWETAFPVSQKAPAGGERTPRKRNWLLAQPCFGGYAFHTEEDCCRRGDQYRPCPGCLVFLISLIEGSTRISVHISFFNTFFTSSTFLLAKISKTPYNKFYVLLCY